jgi:hypothetical protein
MRILSKLTKKLTSFYKEVVCKLEKAPEKDLLKGNKPLSWWRKIKNNVMDKEQKQLSDKDFYDLERIKIKLSILFGDDDFKTTVLHTIILNDNDLKTWIITTNKNIYFVIDNGSGEINPIKRSKPDFKYITQEYPSTPNYGKLFINGNDKPIIFNKAYSGDTRQFETFLDDIKNK